MKSSHSFATARALHSLRLAHAQPSPAATGGQRAVAVVVSNRAFIRAWAAQRPKAGAVPSVHKPSRT